VLNQRIDWLWFVLSQVGFGIVAGIVVSRQERVRTWQYLPFAVRAGIEAAGSNGREERRESPAMNRRAILAALPAFALLVCAACTSSPGAPRADSEVVPPSAVVEFSVLYGQNCADVMEQTARVEQLLLWLIPFFSQC